MRRTESSRTVGKGLKHRERSMSWTVANGQQAEPSQTTGKLNHHELKRAKCISNGEARWIGNGKARNGNGEAVFTTVRLGLATVRVRISNGERVNQRWSESESATVRSESARVRSGFSLFTIWKYREQSFLWESDEWGKFNKTKRGWITFLV